MAFNALEVTQKLSGLVSQALEQMYHLPTIFKPSRFEIEHLAGQLTRIKCCSTMLIDYCESGIEIAPPLVKAIYGTITIIEELRKSMSQLTKKADLSSQDTQDNREIFANTAEAFFTGLHTERLILQHWISAYQKSHVEYMFSHALRVHEGRRLPSVLAQVLQRLVGIPRSQMYDRIQLYDLWVEEVNKVDDLGADVFRRRPSSAWEVWAWMDTQNGRVKDWEIPESYDDPPPPYAPLEAAGLTKVNSESVMAR